MISGEIEGKWSHFWEKKNLSLLWVQYHLNLAFVHFIKFTRKSWHGSDPPFLAMHLWYFIEILN